MRQPTVTLWLAAAAMLFFFQSCSWSCENCVGTPECVRSCPPDQQFDGCFCISTAATSGDAGPDDGAGQ